MNGDRPERGSNGDDRADPPHAGAKHKEHAGAQGDQAEHASDDGPADRCPEERIPRGAGRVALPAAASRPRYRRNLPAASNGWIGADFGCVVAARSIAVGSTRTPKAYAPAVKWPSTRDTTPQLTVKTPRSRPPTATRSLRGSPSTAHSAPRSCLRPSESSTVTVDKRTSGSSVNVSVTALGGPCRPAPSDGSDETRSACAPAGGDAHSIAAPPTSAAIRRRRVSCFPFEDEPRVRSRPKRAQRPRSPRHAAG